MSDESGDELGDELEPAPAAEESTPLPPATPAKGRRWQRELLSWLIPIFALVFGFGYRCVREPIFVERQGVPAGGVTVKPGEIASVAVFPIPEGNRKVKITGVHLSGATKGLELVTAVARSLQEGSPTIGQVGPPKSSHKLSSVEFQAQKRYYVVLELKAAKPGTYEATGVHLDYHSGIQRGTHRMKVTIRIKVQ